MTQDSFAISLVDQLTTAVMVLDETLSVCYFNTATCAVLGLGEKKLKQQFFPGLFQHIDLKANHLYNAMQSKQAFSVSDVQAVLIDGRHLLLDISVTIIEQQPIYLLLELRQVDHQRKISMESLQQHQHLAARELIRGLAHEIKNPLGGLRGAAQLLEESLDDEQKEYTQLIIAQADRLRNLVDRLLGPYRPPSLQQSNLHQVAEQVLKLANMDNPQQIYFQRDYDPSIPDFMFDPELLEQALLNIVRNAQQALVDGGQITLQSRILHQHTLHGKRYKLVACIKVIDNGPGIPVAIRDTLFYPMVSGKAGGTGLGLSIAQTLIHQQRGWIDCESWPGHTGFMIYLPISDCEDDV
ncbi:nitrogen regulation protein NR(II) [Alishewanella sp. HL-SH06]|uniref:nitrogen regulation protein NR(II) n=1 Tax=Alishewanella sp. HL-SH06 TaxID=3461144 RepID=UPI0040438E2B